MRGSGTTLGLESPVRSRLSRLAQYSLQLLESSFPLTPKPFLGRCESIQRGHHVWSAGASASNRRQGFVVVDQRVSLISSGFSQLLETERYFPPILYQHALQTKQFCHLIVGFIGLPGPFRV